jgi:hypothetical protein
VIRTVLPPKQSVQTPSHYNQLHWYWIVCYHPWIEQRSLVLVEWKRLPLINRQIVVCLSLTRVATQAVQQPVN